MHRFRGRVSASTIYLIYSGASALFFALIVTVNLVYQVEIAKLTPLQLVLVGTGLEAVCFICQIPTGVLADVYSRRLAVIIGTLIVGVGFVIEGSFPHFATIVLAQGLFGVGATLTDGAEQAWIAGEVGEERVGSIFLRSSQVGLLGGLVGAALSAILANIRLNVPILIGAAAIIGIAVFLIFFMPEDGFQPTPKEDRQSWRQMGKTFRDGLRLVRIRPVLGLILLVGLFYGLSSEGFDRLSIAHFLSDFTFPTLWLLKPVTWFGLFTVAGTLLSLGGTEFIRRTVHFDNQRMITRALFWVNAVGVLSLLVFGLTGNFPFAVAAYLGYRCCRSVGNPIYTTWLTQHIDAKVRATVISMSGQVDALGQIVGGPPVGYIGNVVSLRAAMVATSIILSPVLLLFALVSKRSKTGPADDIHQTLVEQAPV
ncbi:MAG TPA: MFS transporter [Ktedonobacter sp.]|nr:MFS transporter [Ktedonobacter sp.]